MSNGLSADTVALIKEKLRNLRQQEKDLGATVDDLTGRLLEAQTNHEEAKAKIAALTADLPSEPPK